MASERITYRLCRHLQELWDRGPGFTLEYGEAWTTERSQKVSRQTLSRVLHGEVTRLQPRTARSLALFLEAHTGGRLNAATLLLEEPDESTTPMDEESGVIDTVESLLREADDLARLPDTRAALNRYLDGLEMTAEGEGRPLANLRRQLYERLGDLHLLSLWQPSVGRGYYEAAQAWALSTKEQAVLCCRLAETHARSPRALEYLQHVSGLLMDDDCADLEGWVLYLYADQAHTEARFEDATRLAAKALSRGHLPDDIALKASRLLHGTSGPTAPTCPAPKSLYGTDPSMQARQLRARAERLIQEGQLLEARSVLSETLAFCQRHALRAETTGVLAGLGIVSLHLGEVETSRRYALRAVQAGADPQRCYLSLCRSWLHDQHPDGIWWAGELLAALRTSLFLRLKGQVWQDDYPFSHTPWGKSLHRLGWAEMILRAGGQVQEFCGWVDGCRRLGPDRGEVWVFSDPVQLETLGPTSDVGWQAVPGSDDGCVVFQDGACELSSAPLRGLWLGDAPVWVREVRGDFALEATVQPAELVRKSIIGARARPLATRLATAWGSAGLFLRSSTGEAVRLFAHMHVPGEVLCEAHAGGEKRILGRGLVDAGTLRLRLDRHDGILRAWAGDEHGWYACGELPAAWSPAELGLVGEAIIDLYPITRRHRVRFEQVGLAL